MLFAPSPEMSMVRRLAMNGLCSRMSRAKSMAPLIEVPPPNNCRGTRSMAPAKSSAVAASLIWVHGTTRTCSRGPVHWNMVTPIDWVISDWIALSTRGLRNAAA